MKDLPKTLHARGALDPHPCPISQPHRSHAVVDAAENTPFRRAMVRIDAAAFPVRGWAELCSNCADYVEGFEDQLLLDVSKMCGPCQDAYLNPVGRRS